MSSAFADTKRLNMIVRYILDKVPRYTQTELGKDLTEFAKFEFPNTKIFSTQYLSELKSGHRIVSNKEKNALDYALPRVLEKHRLTLNFNDAFSHLRGQYEPVLREVYGDEISVGDLGDELIKAATETNGELSIDLICYTSHTFEVAFASLLDQALSDPKSLKSITVRLMVWSCEGSPILPLGVDGQRDGGYLALVRGRRTQYADRIISIVNQMKGERPDIAISFRMKFSPFEPSFKGAIINNTSAFWTLYNISRVEPLVSGQRQANWDYRGQGLSLTKVDKNSAAFEAISRWFQVIWDDFATPVE